MNVTGCVPLAGRGLVARSGTLVAVTDGMDAGPDPLLAVLAAVTAANDDGTALVLAATRAALEHGGRPAWACAGVTSGGKVTVLVHGAAVAVVSVAGGQEAEVTASGSMIPVVRTFAGAAVTVRLAVDAQAARDPRLWLGAGTVSGGGILLELTQETSQIPLPNEWQAPATATLSPAVDQAVDPDVDQGVDDTAVSASGSMPAGAVPFTPRDSALLEPAAPVPDATLLDAALPDATLPETMPPEATLLDAALPASLLPGAVPPDQGSYPPGYQPTMLAWPVSAAEAPGAGPATGTQADPYAESWFSAEAEPAGPTLRLTRTDGPAPGGAAIDDPAAGGLSEPPVADISTIELVQLDPVAPVVVDGAMCGRMHFNPPDALACRACGASMREVTRNMRRLPRPPLGVLLIDDGRGYVLDRDYVIGREPLLDGDVAAGRATSLPISDPEGSVSRLHLRVSLVGWQVEVHDLGSSNGSVLYRAGAPRTLAPLDAAVLDPGVRVGVGRRSVQFLPYGASPR